MRCCFLRLKSFLNLPKQLSCLVKSRDLPLHCLVSVSPCLLSPLFGLLFDATHRLRRHHFLSPSQDLL